MQFPLLVLSCAAPENCFYPGYKFHHSKRLRDIIIRTALQTFHLIKFRFFGSDHDHRDIPGPGIAFQPFQNIISIFSREHNVQKDQFRQAFFHRCVKLHSCLKPFCLESGCLQGIDKKLPDVSFIFHTVDHSTSLSVRYTGCFFCQPYFYFFCFQYNYFPFTAQALVLHTFADSQGI